jgi:sialidase-1
MALRTRRGTVLRRAHAYSDDGGHSWSHVAVDQNLPDPHCHGSILSVPGPVGKDRLVLVNPASANERLREKLTVRVSEDGGKSWTSSRVLYKGLAAYSDMILAPHGKVLCLFEADDYQKLIVASFDVP